VGKVRWGGLYVKYLRYNGSEVSRDFSWRGRNGLEVLDG